MRNTKNAWKETREITGEHKRKHSTNTNMITHVLEPRNTKIHGPNPTKDDTSGGSSSPRGGLESTSDLPVKGS